MVHPITLGTSYPKGKLKFNTFLNIFIIVHSVVRLPIGQHGQQGFLKLLLGPNTNMQCAGVDYHMQCAEKAVE